MKSLFNSAIPYIICIFLAFVSYKMIVRYFDDRQTIRRLTDNLAATQKEAEYFKARNGDQAVKLQSQELTIKELRATLPAAIQDLKNLYIAPRQLNAYTQAVSDLKYAILTKLKDSIIHESTPINPDTGSVTIKDSLKVRIINYADKWFSVKGIIKEDSAKLSVRSRDTITYVNYLSRRPHPWLWIFGGRRHPECIISNKNPYNKISIEKSISIKR